MTQKDRFAPSSNGASVLDNNAADLLAEFQQIERVWKLAEDKVASTHVPVDVIVSVRDGFRYSEGNDSPCGEFSLSLAYAKVKGSRRICLVTSETYYGPDQSITESKPIVECPVDIRMEMFEHFPALYQEAKAVSESYVPRIREAIAKFEKTLKWIDVI